MQLTRDVLLRSLVPLALTSWPAAPALALPDQYCPYHGKQCVAGQFKRLNPIQFIAALGDPAAASGKGTDEWGLWTVDPGPRGVELRDFPALERAGGVAPAKWKFDPQNYWLEEHGLIMEAPTFPVPAGQYVVTGGRKVRTVLRVGADRSWSLEDGQLYDVTHLPCRAARYTGGSPANARQADFPVTPGAPMPAVEGSRKQDYAVLFVIGVEA